MGFNTKMTKFRIIWGTERCLMILVPPQPGVSEKMGHVPQFLASLSFFEWGF